MLIIQTGPLDRQLSNGADARRRKRRDAFSFQTEEFAGGSLTVGYSVQEDQPRAAQLKKTTEVVYDKTRCMQGLAFILPLAVMAMMLLASMSTTFAFCVRSDVRGQSLWKLNGFKTYVQV